MPRIRHLGHQPRPVPVQAETRKSDKPMSQHAALLGMRGTPMVYAMRLPDGVIKIGWSANLVTRVRQLKGEIIALCVGTIDDERAIHHRLAGLAVRGREYYPPAPEVLAIVNDMRAEWNLEPIAS